MTRKTIQRWIVAIIVGVGLVTAFLSLTAQQARAPEVAIGATDLGGVVTSTSGPEAGVWVIAETTDLPTKFAKMVVTDDRGRYVIPDLPKATYNVWVRGYGLVDSPKVKATPGTTSQPDRDAGADCRRGGRILSRRLLVFDAADSGQQRISGHRARAATASSQVMKTQHYWIDTVKNSCQSCHALGSKGVRTIPRRMGPVENSIKRIQAWTQRLQAGQASANMAVTLSRLGPQKALSLFADWTDRIAAGELPFAKPERPQGVERNVVISMWEWSTPKAYLHDAISTDKRNPRVNANGLDLRIAGGEHRHGAGAESDHQRGDADEASLSAIPRRLHRLDLPRGHSPYWGDEAIWDGHTSIHNPIIDEKGRVWFTARIRAAAEPGLTARPARDHPSAKVAPLDTSGRQLSMYDPKTGKWSLIDTCFDTQHLYFAKDANNTLWTSAGGPDSGVVGWLNTKMYEQTGDEVKSQGWTPLIIDTNGNGKRDEYVEANQPLDPKKDKRVMAAFYGVQPSPVDDSIWGQAMDVGFSRIDQPGYIIRLVPGPNPSQTALAEVYLPPDIGYGSRGIDLDLNGVVWTTLSSGHLASFDRRKCKGPLNGPAAATGKHCPEGWTLYPVPGTAVQGRHRPRQRRPRLFPLGRSIQHAGTRSRTCRSRRPTAASRFWRS